MSSEENTTVMQVCLVALKRQTNASTRAKHDIWIEGRCISQTAPLRIRLPAHIWFSASLPRSSRPHSRTIIHQCGMGFLVSFPAAIQSINRFTSRKFELFIAPESILALACCNKQVTGADELHKISSTSNWKEWERQTSLISGVITLLKQCWRGLV